MKTKRPILSVYLDSKLHKMLKKAAIDNETTIIKLVDEAIRRLLDEMERERPRSD